MWDAGKRYGHNSDMIVNYECNRLFSQHPWNSRPIQRIFLNSKRGKCRGRGVSEDTTATMEAGNRAAVYRSCSWQGERSRDG
jgi:hypothetical protein